MRLSAKKYMILLLIIALILFLGYYRDFIFITINSIIQAKYYEAAYTPAPSLHFFNQYKSGTLMKIKWLLTVFFSIAYLLLALVALWVLFNEKKYYQITVGVYAVVMLLSGVFMVIGYTFHNLSGRMYEFARYLMGMAQSPLILMILIPAFKLSKQEPNNITN